MPIIAVTRARLKSVRFLLPFMRCSLQCWWKARNAEGNLGSRVRKTRGLRFWTMTMWDNEDSLKAYRDIKLSGQVRSSARQWLEENSIAHWEQEGSRMPSWKDAACLLKEHGHLSEVDHPSESQKSGQIDIS